MSRKCPDCDVLGDYQGIAQRGDNWTGSTYARMWCGDCGKRWQIKRTWTQSPRSDRLAD